MAQRGIRVPYLVWLRPGAHLKRWVLLAGIALVACSLGVGIVMADFYRQQHFPEWVWYATLQFIPRLPRGLLLASIGLTLGAFALYRFSRSLVGAILPGPSGAVIQQGLERRRLQAGPKVVAIGGGHGLSTLLKGLKGLTANTTAIVTVADDGGSSGKLRRDLGILPPGDFRQCLVALADAEPLMAELLQHRFKESSHLAGHSFGNLFLTAMAEITGSFDKALEESSRVLAVRGRVLPSTLEDVTLCAELEDGRVVMGESMIGHAGSPIKRVYLDPPNAAGHSDAVQAILEADAVIVGPGSLYTSVLPNLLVSDIGWALSKTRAKRVYVCNVATEEGETSGYSVSDFVRAIENHLGSFPIDCVLANNNLPRGSAYSSVELVPTDRGRATRSQVLEADLISDQNPAHHDPRKLASALERVALT